MDFPSFPGMFATILGGVCVVGVPLLLFIGWIISGVMDNKQQEKREAQNGALRKRGVTAPAIIVSARTVMARSSSGRKEIRIDYEVDVEPEARAPFRQSFQHWTERRNYTAIAGNIVGEQGKKIWVTYDPNHPSHMIFEHEDSEHEEIARQQDVDARRLKFNELTKFNEELKKTGEPAEAVILRAEDLDLPYPAKGSRAMKFYFDVFPASGASFKSEANALIGGAAVGKYSAGKRVYIRFDPRQPERAVLDTERNKTLK